MRIGRPPIRIEFGLPIFVNFSPIYLPPSRCSSVPLDGTVQEGETNMDHRIGGGPACRSQQWLSKIKKKSILQAHHKLIVKLEMPVGFSKQEEMMVVWRQYSSGTALPSASQQGQRELPSCCPQHLCSRDISVPFCPSRQVPLSLCMQSAKAKLPLPPLRQRRALRQCRASHTRAW